MTKRPPRIVAAALQLRTSSGSGCISASADRKRLPLDKRESATSSIWDNCLNLTDGRNLFDKPVAEELQRRVGGNVFVAAYKLVGFLGLEISLGHDAEASALHVVFDQRPMRKTNALSGTSSRQQCVLIVKKEV